MVGRGDLPFLPLHGRALLEHGLQALRPTVATVLIVIDPEHRYAVEGLVGDLSRVIIAPSDSWHLGLEGGPLLIHDPLCPLTSAGFLEEMLRQIEQRPTGSIAAYRPVTDTVKTVQAGRIQGTIDREKLVAITSPVAVSRRHFDNAVALGGAPPLDDFAALVGWLRQHGSIEFVKGPSMGRRVDDASSVTLLECVDELGRQVHSDGK